MVKKANDADMAAALQQFAAAEAHQEAAIREQGTAQKEQTEAQNIFSDTDQYVQESKEVTKLDKEGKPIIQVIFEQIINPKWTAALEALNAAKEALETANREVSSANEEVSEAEADVEEAEETEETEEVEEVQETGVVNQTALENSDGTTIQHEDNTTTKIIEADENGNKVVENYDAEGNLKSKVTYGEPEIVTQYNSDGSRTETYEKNGFRYIDEYKTNNTKTTSEMLPDSREVQSIKNYDANGNITSETYIDKDGAETLMPKVKIYNPDNSSIVYTYRLGKLNNVEKLNANGDTEWDLYVDPFGSNDEVKSGTPDYDEINANREKADTLEAEFEAVKKKNEKVSKEAEKIEAQAREATEKSDNNHSTVAPTTNPDTNNKTGPAFNMQSAFLNTDFTKTNSTDNNTAPEATTPANTTEQAIEASEFTGTELEGTNIDEDIKDLPKDSTHTVTKNDNGTYTVDIDFGNGKTGKMEYSDKGSINSGRIDYPDGSRDEITTDAEGKITTKYDTNNNIKETVLENEDGSSTKIIEADENGNKAVENYDSNGEIKSKIIYGDDGEAEKVIEYNSDGTRDVYFEDEGQTHVLYYNTDGTRTDTFEIDGTTYVIKYDSNGDEEYSAIMREDETTRIYQCLDDVYYIFQYDENGNLDSISNEYGEFMEYNDDGEIERTSVSSEEKINTKYIDKRIKEAIKDKENSTQTKQDYETSTNNAQKTKSKAEFAKLRARDVQ